MLDRLLKLLLGGGGLLRAEAQLAAHTFRRVLVATIAIGIALALAAVALIVLAVAGLVMLAQEIGWAPAAAVVSGSILLVSLIVVVIAKMSMPRKTDGSPEEARSDAERSKREMQDAVTPEDQTASASETPGAHGSTTGVPGDWKDKAAGFVAEHPIEVASATFAVLALVGPFRALRLASRGAAVAGVVGSLMQHAKPDEPTKGVHTNGTEGTAGMLNSQYASTQGQARATVYDD